MLKLELVMDESGGNRPQNTETSAAFSVAGLLYPSDLREDIWQKAKKLGDEIGTAKYKYREVIESDVGREKFLHLLHTETQLRIYVFYSGANAMAHEIDRSLAAHDRIKGVGSLFLTRVSGIDTRAVCPAAPALQLEILRIMS